MSVHCCVVVCVCSRHAVRAARSRNRYARRGFGLQQLRSRRDQAHQASAGHLIKRIWRNVTRICGICEKHLKGFALHVNHRTSCSRWRSNAMQAFTSNRGANRRARKRTSSQPPFQRGEIYILSTHRADPPEHHCANVCAVRRPEVRADRSRQAAEPRNDIRWNTKSPLERQNVPALDESESDVTVPCLMKPISPNFVPSRRTAIFLQRNMPARRIDSGGARTRPRNSPTERTIEKTPESCCK
jgi:hypothetical protein